MFPFPVRRAVVAAASEVVPKVRGSSVAVSHCAWCCRPRSCEKVFTDCAPEGLWWVSEVHQWIESAKLSREGDQKGFMSTVYAMV